VLFLVLVICDFYLKWRKLFKNNTFVFVLLELFWNISMYAMRRWNKKMDVYQYIYNCWRKTKLQLRYSTRSKVRNNCFIVSKHNLQTISKHKGSFHFSHVLTIYYKNYFFFWVERYTTHSQQNHNSLVVISSFQRCT
jgi:hypothetical protein